ncbi:MAG: glycosyl hydrolase family 95 catalytic domain-containing protein [Thermoguttaceae bacterium]
MCVNLWEYYEFTQDLDVLKQIYPLMRDLAKFYQSIIVEDPTSGELVVVPSISCEHSGFGIGTTFEMALSYWLMQTAIESGEILDVDEDFRAELARTSSRIDPFKIGADGQLKEWREEDHYNQWPQGGNIGDPHHRHMSHLLTQRPANLITDQTPELMLAANESLNRRNAGGQEKVGWSITQNVCLYARMGLTENAYRRLNFYIASGTVLPNLFNLEIVNEITLEANGAFTGVVAVSWEPVENAARYVVYRRLDDGSDRVRNTGVYAPIATTETTSYRDTNASPTPEGKYFYQVSAVSKDGAEGDVSFHTPTSPAESAAK